jgi:hypothetical protein
MQTVLMKGFRTAPEAILENYHNSGHLNHPVFRLKLGSPNYGPRANTGPL